MSERQSQLKALGKAGKTGEGQEKPFLEDKHQQQSSPPALGRAWNLLSSWSQLRKQPGALQEREQLINFPC